MYFVRYLYCLPVLFSILLGSINASNELFVLFPSAFFWNATNVVYVTPLLTAHDHVDVWLLVEEEQGENPRRKVFGEQQLRRPTMQTSIFNVKLPADSVARRYYVTVTLAGHTEFHGHVNGVSDVATIFLQTDKSFYQPDETVAIRALPITNNGELYVGDVEFQLLDPNGFRIFNKTLSVNASRGAAFIETDFALPNHVRFGEWRVVASAGNSFRRAIRPIRVQEYMLPKYHIFMSIVKSEESPFIVSATVMARFANGMQLSGDVFFGCTPLSDRGDEVGKAPTVTIESPAADAPSPLRRKIGKGGVGRFNFN